LPVVVGIGGIDPLPDEFAVNLATMPKTIAACLNPEPTERDRAAQDHSTLAARAQRESAREAAS